MGDGRIRLDHGRRSNPRGRAAVFRRQDHIRRHDDGGGRVHPGAELAALVRRQLQHHCGLASHAAAGCELPACADRHRIRARRREPDRVRSRGTRRDGVRGAASRFAGGARGVPGATRRDPGRRARPDLRSAGRGQDAAVSRAVGTLALGQRSYRPPARRSGDVRAARHAVPPPRHAARSARVPVDHPTASQIAPTCRRSRARGSGGT